MEFTVEQVKEKKFDPIKINIEINTLDELSGFLARLVTGATSDSQIDYNATNESIKKFYPLWNELDNLHRKLK